MRSEVSLYSSEADCRQPGGGQGLELVAQAGEGRREEAPLPFGLLGEVPLFSLFVFHLPGPSGLPGFP